MALSRDEGVALATTEHFLLLDGHMRVWQDDWHSLISRAIAHDPRAIYCCQTVVLDDDFEERKNRPQHQHGAYVNWDTFLLFWNMAPGESGPVQNVAAVMGASYAAQTAYWKKLRGLMGLRSYGFDEQLISIKAWLEGGSCKLLNTVRFAHLFRTTETMPYTMQEDDYYYNLFYLAELFLYGNEKQSFYERAWQAYGTEVYGRIRPALMESKDFIMAQKTYFRTIFTRDLHWIETLNRQAMAASRPHECHEQDTQVA